MFEKSHCSGCGRELTGVIVSTFAQDGPFVVIVSQESTDCNWTPCKGCGTVLCKECKSAVPWYCCEEDKIVERERVQASINGHGSFSRLMERSGDAIKRLNSILSRPRFKNPKNKQED